MKRQKIPKRLIELSLTGATLSPEHCAILRTLLIRLGIPSQNIAERSQDGHSGVLTFIPSRAEAQALKKRLEGLRLKKIAVRLTVLDRPDWQEKWKRDFSPFALTRHLDVVPVWRKKNYQPDPGREPILLDTITAFGTGLHDTTRFMSLFIERCSGQFESFLDVGTGTGILSLVALKSGARFIAGIDIDAECIPVARSNMERNGGRFAVLQAVEVGRFHPQRKFDYVAANLISHDLIRFKRTLLALVNPKKFLAVSGIAPENLAGVKNAFARSSLRCLKIERSPFWAALLYQKI